MQVQERLQALVRRRAWNVFDEDLQDSSWTFTRELSTQELLAGAEPDPSTRRVRLVGGRALMVVQTIELPDRYTRVTVRAKLKALGESSDHFAPNRDEWDLKSNGKMEQALIDELPSWPPTKP